MLEKLKYEPHGGFRELICLQHKQKNQNLMSSW